MVNQWMMACLHAPIVFAHEQIVLNLEWRHKTRQNLKNLLSLSLWRNGDSCKSQQVVWCRSMRLNFTLFWHHVWNQNLKTDFEFSSCKKDFSRGSSAKQVQLRWTSSCPVSIRRTWELFYNALFFVTSQMLTNLITFLCCLWCVEGWMSDCSTKFVWGRKKFLACFQQSSSSSQVFNCLRNTLIFHSVLLLCLSCSTVHFERCTFIWKLVHTQHTQCKVWHCVCWNFWEGKNVCPVRD